MNKRSLKNILIVTFFIVGKLAFPQDSITTAPLVSYGKKGFELTSSDNNYLMQIEFRGQFRFAYPYDSDPVTLEDFDSDNVSLYLNRARMKVGGHSFKPWLKYYLEYELMSSNLLDFRLMIEKYKFLNIKVGQWKVQYNRERIISSGKQQSVERSILTRPFTIDRQQGISLYGHLDGRGAANFNYWVSVFMGTGRGAEVNDDRHLMWMTRWQWNFMGKPLEFTGSDLKYHNRLTAVVALAAVTNKSAFTRFSQSGGGELQGFPEGKPGQYRVNQWLIETAAKYRGFSWQQEFHWKQINDEINKHTSTMTGNLVQAGYFPYHLWSKFPETMELYARQAFYIPDMSKTDQVGQEYSIGANYFINGHRNKLTLEYSWLQYKSPNDENEGGRIRLQWDISL